MSRKEQITEIKNRLKTYPDFPKPGILFYDVFTLFHKPSLQDMVVDLFVERLKATHDVNTIDMVIGIDSRGFLFGPEIAKKIGCTFLPARKKGKLPGKTLEKTYKLEYGEATVEMQKEYLIPGKTAVIVDDLIATGGTMAATYTLLVDAGINVIECQCVFELNGLNGRKNLPNGCNLFCLVDLDED